MQLICDVFKSRLVDDLYLYVEKTAGLEGLPDILMNKFGPPEHVMSMLITPSKALAKASGEQILSEIAKQGFYLQLPSKLDDDLRYIADKNVKLTRRGLT